MVWPTEFDTTLDEYDKMELPGQQLPASQACTPFDHLMNLDINVPAGCLRLTGIIATIGKKCSSIDMLEKMMAAGMNIALLNMSFDTREEHVEYIKHLRAANKNYSIRMGRNYPLGIAARLTGRKIRTGRIAEIYGETVELRTGDSVRLTSDETYKLRCTTNTLFIDFVNFGDHMNRGDLILLDNETIRLKVEVISSTTLTCIIDRGGLLGSYKDVYIPNVVFDVPNYSDKDKHDIEMLISNQVDLVVTPFTHGPDTVIELRGILGEKGKRIGIVADIQSIEGFNNYDAILQVANGVIVSRQELGSDISPKKLVIAQKNMIARANKANIPVSISAQLLSSMRYRKMPLRAELLDVSNCILDGADSLVLSAETAVGEYPVETVATLAETCKEAEACIWSKQIYRDLVDKTPIPCDQMTAAALSAVLAAQRVMAAAIIAVTTTGRSAHAVAKYRPRCPIFAVTRYAPIARQMHLYRGIIPVVFEDPLDPEWQTDLENRVNFCAKWGMERGFIRIGDPVVLVSGWRQGSGFTNTMRVIYAAADSTAL